jgi:hypothetical protein
MMKMRATKNEDFKECLATKVRYKHIHNDEEDQRQKEEEVYAVIISLKIICSRCVNNELKKTLRI